MKANAKLLRIDVIGQKVILGLYLFCGFLGVIISALLFLAMLIQILLGLWQVFSALAFSVNGHARRRKSYLWAILAYFILFLFSTSLMLGNIVFFDISLMVIGLIIIPLALAIWYLNISQTHYEQVLKTSEFPKDLDKGMEDILDSEELLKNNSYD